MNLNIYHHNFIVCGAGSGLGKGVAASLLEEGAIVYAITKTASKLEDLKKTFPNQLNIFAFDLTDIKNLNDFFRKVKDIKFSGALINAGGPPAKAGMETSLRDWDESYKNLFRWKIFFTQEMIKRFEKEEYGRLLFIESSAVKQPIDNLILSTSMRLAVVGFAKTLAQEVANKGITVNILAPGFHDTPAIDRVFAKKSEVDNSSLKEAKAKFMQLIPAGELGKASEFGIMASFLLSPSASYITGQTISIDGGLTKFVFG